ncbi:hypothetical protein N0V93_010279 [Gnomoniopsis smithogilvyi]|uniref:Uncharacterized protein n=1 Tax=Gnomoniopsis smithogilvyi TaxID=1191159 RepID=A0A9W9CSQ3_9PEZI|nr:hypothetical protein N0V93_010279 [Gnomoniopsis smithogilvyi]
MHANCNNNLQQDEGYDLLTEEERQYIIKWIQDVQRYEFNFECQDLETIEPYSEPMEVPNAKKEEAHFPPQPSLPHVSEDSDDEISVIFLAGSPQLQQKDTEPLSQFLLEQVSEPVESYGTGFDAYFSSQSEIPYISEDSFEEIFNMELEQLSPLFDTIPPLTTCISTAIGYYD